MNRIVLLSEKNIDSAMLLIEKVFLYEDDRELARINLVETLEHKNHGQNYWFATDENGRVIGMTGLYLNRKTEPGDETVWLGWFGVHPEYRRQGIGSALLEFTVNEAKRRGFKTMKIYTSTDENERQAHKLYESFGFEKTVLLNDNGFIYKTKKLSKLNGQLNWGI